MKKWFVFLIILNVASLCCCAQKNEITTFILLRHAEKVEDGTKDPELNPEGNVRAKRLSEVFKDTRLDAIYSTNFKRTRNTVDGLAKEKGLVLQQYESFKTDVIEKMVKDHPGGTVLICGHSNDVPWIANLLIGREEYKTFASDDYSNIVIVTVVEKGKNAKVTFLRY